MSKRKPEQATYYADYTPGDNYDFPFHVVRHGNDPGNYEGPCFEAIPAAVIAWALTHQEALINSSQTLQGLCNDALDTVMRRNEQDMREELR